MATGMTYSQTRARPCSQVLREQLSLTGTKCGCNNGVCGSCTVLIDDLPMRACLTLAVAATDREITTIEGLETGGWTASGATGLH